MGALGLLFGGEIAAGAGNDAVRFIADAKRVAQYGGQTFTINAVPHEFAIEDAQVAKPADLVLVAVKYGALEQALDTMATSIGPETIVISVLNGINSEKIIAQRYPDTCVLYAVAQGMDAMKSGASLSYTRPGELLLGMKKPGQEEKLAALTDFFQRAGVPYSVAEDILHGMWGKFMLNVGVNQACMAYQTNYAGVLAPGEARDKMLSAMEEVKVLGNHLGIALTDGDVAFYIKMLENLSPDGVPSMAQDAIAKRPSEVEMFAGTIRALCRENGLQCPTNDLLYERIGQIEAGYAKPHL